MTHRITTGLQAVITRAAGLLGMVMLMGHASSQEINAEMDAPGSQFFIGEHVPLTLKVTADKNILIQWPVTGDTLATGLVVLKKGSTDTAKSEGGLYTYSQTITVTVFDSGTYTVDPIIVRFSNPGSSFIKEAYTPSLLLTFSLAELTDEEELRDLKPPFSFPVTFREALIPGLISLLFVVGIIMLIRFIRRRKRRRRAAPEAVIPVPEQRLEPWQIALEALDHVKFPAMPQEVKGYYETVSGIVREYLRDGLSVNAPELTTRQVLRRIAARRDISTRCHGTLQRILQISDLVKFAKLVPIGVQHQALMEDARTFVADTAPAFVAGPTELHREEEP